MASRRQRARQRNLRERERRRRQVLESIRNEYIESENNFESLQDFEEAINTPFDDFDVETDDVVRNMQDEFNGQDTEDNNSDWRQRAERNRRRTFNENWGTTDSQYDTISHFLGSEIYQKLKEIYEYDSHQFRQTLMGFGSDVSDEDIEVALTQLLLDLEINGGVRLLNEDAIIEAMEMGFTYEEAVELTQQDREMTQASSYNIDQAVRDYVRSQSIQRNSEQRARQNIRNRYEERTRGRV